MSTLKLADVKVGDELVADAGFTCLFDHQIVQVCEDKNMGLYIPCRDGRHYLDGQRNKYGDLVGFLKYDDASMKRFIVHFRKVER